MGDHIRCPWRRRRSSEREDAQPGAQKADKYGQVREQTASRSTCPASRECFGCGWAAGCRECRRVVTRSRPWATHGHHRESRRRHRHPLTRQRRNQVFDAGVVANQNHRADLVGQFPHETEELGVRCGVHAVVEPRWWGRGELRRGKLPRAPGALRRGHDRQVNLADTCGQPSPGVGGLTSATLRQRPEQVGLASRPVRLRVPQQDQGAVSHPGCGSVEVVHPHSLARQPIYGHNSGSPGGVTRRRGLTVLFGLGIAWRGVRVEDEKCRRRRRGVASF